MGIISKFFTGLFKQKKVQKNVSFSNSVDVVTDLTFGGVVLSKLNELAKSIYHGIGVTIDNYGFLVFHYTSHSGKTKYHSQIKINEAGKLVKLFSGHHNNQWWSSADEFVKKANELFTFRK